MRKVEIGYAESPMINGPTLTPSMSRLGRPVIKIIHNGAILNNFTQK